MRDNRPRWGEAQRKTEITDILMTFRRAPHDKLSVEKGAQQRHTFLRLTKRSTFFAEAFLRVLFTADSLGFFSLGSVAPLAAGLAPRRSIPGRSLLAGLFFRRRWGFRSASIVLQARP